MKCPYCGHKNPTTSRRCARCGRRLDRIKERRRERRILIYGGILILLILAAGVGAMFAISKVMDTATSAANQPQKVKIVTTPTPEITEEPEEEEPAAASSSSAAEEEEPQEEVEEKPAEVTASLVDDSRKSQIPLLGYAPVTVANATATSTIVQEGIDNSPYVLYDGQYWSSWQDGVEGDGLGENITFTFDRDYQVKFIVLRLGNWYSTDDYYIRNNRPEKMTFEIGGKSFEVTFPDEKREFCLEFSEDLTAASLRMTINSVYKGTEYEDTCINEVDVYGY